MIGRPAFVDAVHRHGLFLESLKFQQTVHVEASSDPAAVVGAELVLFCVKTLDTEAAAKSLGPYLAPNAVVLSLQNGVENVERIRAAAGIVALPAVVYVSASVPTPGRVKHAGRGELLIGLPKTDARSPQAPAIRGQLQRIAATFEQAAVPCNISRDIDAELWSKLVLNCMGNPVTAIAQASYGAAAREPMARELMAMTGREAVAIARALGIELSAEALLAQGLRFAEGMGGATSSTAQDVARKKKTEIDALNGMIVRRGREMGIATPVNSALVALIKLMEAKF